MVGSTTSVVFEEYGANNDDDAVWEYASASLNAFAGQTVYLLIQAADASGGSLVEAGVDDVLVMTQPPLPPAEILFVASFNNGSDGFSYQDDAFHGTNQPGYASGSYEASGGVNGGGLRVYLGGLNDNVINNMSGGWNRTFTLSNPKEVIVSFYCQLNQASEYESDEYSQALFSIDGVLYGLEDHDYLAQFSRGWQRGQRADNRLATGRNQPGHTLRWEPHHGDRRFQ